MKPAPTGRAAALAAALLLAACSPTLDWRQVRPEDSGIEALFPCKPLTHARTVPLAGTPTRMMLYACTTGGMTFALTYAELDDPARVTPALEALRAAASANLDGQETLLGPAEVPGMTPNPAALRLSVQGRRPDGGALAQQLVLFAHGTRVFQASVIGAQPEDEPVATFLAGLRRP
ncbi:hypothetical protein IS481_03220 [Caldimonas thermodepolymerans]|jgi:hypothetical protein|uniref:DUF1795 domain-containing protein n=1 Tax=Caldimonas thermodepolymerans TaxID=215580 RepID=A0A2S5T5D3_9BURK|nr:hypothetical protein [Caldimonas thermodepolymerans]PPE70210.1 hypothetical protein C1702_08105 [Caldimonas thermodepolymerans]QPC32205.1 hypothetical protein IS481_03220 [Caldimonas thermodepolymerans]RDH98093.1 hypothetical protein DES46_10791 [Caldimonas thermodepolymerans]TCP08132.1 hypothetical protein EV676_103165 [Caldimonas thermodepolymerans]UZG48750.1 hypothetical protein ONS87_03760 [Caldimonas thermodepolymerans]